MEAWFRSRSVARVGIRWLAVSCCVTVLLTLVPLFVISFYNHPYYDDFAAGGQLTRKVWQETGSFWALLVSAFSGAHDSYMNWEGNYVPNYLNCIQVSAISQELCFLVTWFLLLAVMVSWSYLCKVLFRDILKASWSIFWISVSIISFLSVQFVPHANEAFFWQSGGIKYTLGHAFWVATGALMLRLVHGRPTDRRTYALKTVALCVLALLSAGSNLMTGLGAVVGMCLYALYLWLYKREGKWAVTLGAVFSLLGFTLNVLAPGNVLRQGSDMAGFPILWTVFTSAYATLEYVGRWTTLPWMAALLLLTPFIYEAARKIQGHFGHPILMLIGSFGMLAAQLAPPIYTGIYYNSGRIVNTLYLSYCLFMLVNWVYLVGYIAARRVRTESPGQEDSGLSLAKRGMSWAVLLSICVTLFVGCAGYGLTKMPGGAALKALVNGQAERYDQAYRQRTALLTAENDLPVTLEPMQDIPLLFMDETYAWKSIMNTLGTFYGKEIVDGRTQ